MLCDLMTRERPRVQFSVAKSLFSRECYFYKLLLNRSLYSLLALSVNIIMYTADYMENKIRLMSSKQALRAVLIQQCSISEKLADTKKFEKSSKLALEKKNTQAKEMTREN